MEPQTHRQAAQNQLESHLHLRAATNSDIGFIFNSWLKSYRNSDMVRKVQSEIYYSAQHKLIENLFQTAKMTVACDVKDASKIFGYICYDIVDGALVIHFAYVKKIYRELGLGKLMLESTGHVAGTPLCYSHWTPICRTYDQKHPAIYHPYLAFEGFSAYKVRKND